VLKHLKIDISFINNNHYKWLDLARLIIQNILST